MIHNSEPGEIEAPDLLKLVKLSPDEALFLAATQYRKMKSGQASPSGKFDNGGRFKISPRLACCQGLRDPSRQFPFGQRDHGRTALHIAHANGIEGRQNDIVQFAHLMDKYPMLTTDLVVSKASIAAAAAQAALQEIA